MMVCIARGIHTLLGRKAHLDWICPRLMLAGLMVLLEYGASASIIRVKPTGNNANNGGSWASAKLTVGNAIAAAATGDEIWVVAGVYHERLSAKNGVAMFGGFAGTETDRNQRDYRTRLTILDGDRGGTVVRFEIPFGGSGTRIDGFTVRNGSGNQGGGMVCVGNAPVIANNVICSNISLGGGGGICCYNGANPQILNNVISDNYASADGVGGGISCMAGREQDTTGSSPLIWGNIIARNRANMEGGGIGSEGRGSLPTILNNLIIENVSSEVASDGGIGGGGIACVSDGSATLIANNVIAANAGLQAGGILIVCGARDNLVIVNNTIVGNNSAGLRWNNTTWTTLIANNLICYNGAGITRWNQAGTPGVSTLENNNIFGNGINFDGVPDPTGVGGNISVDPRLASVSYGNFHLQPDSPCINAGNPLRVGVGWTDMDGQGRVLGGRVDIGADESDGTPWTVTPRIIRVSPTGNDNNDGSSWAAAKRTLTAAITSIHANLIGTFYNLSGGQVWVRQGTYVESNVMLPPFVYLYGGYAENDQRNPALTPSILDGNQAGRVLLAVSGYRLSLIDGFIIQNGRIVSSISDQGGGIECFQSDLTIQNNVLRGNRANLGGAIGGYGSLALIRNNIITNNCAGSDCGGWGGGVHFDRSAPTILNNNIRNNGASDGGGIYLSFSKAQVIGNAIGSCLGNGVYVANTRQQDWFTTFDLLIAQNDIFGNLTSDQGGGIHALLCSGRIVNNLIRQNQAGTASGGGYGGGLALKCGDENNANLIVANNDIILNVALYFDTYFGGGIFVRMLNVPNLILANNIVAGNWGSGIWNAHESPVSPVMVNNLFYSNNGVDYQLMDVYGVITGGPLSHPTDISGNPLFVSDTGDYRLSTSSSPCVDAGSALYHPANDCVGVPRPLQGKVGGQVRPDIGAYEYVNTAVDSDQDGLNDGDEVNLHHTNPLLRDTDGDRMRDGDEISAGTIPTDPSSRLAFTLLTPIKIGGSNAVVLRWLSVPGKAYTLQRATTLAGGSPFQNLIQHLAGQAGSTTCTDRTATATGPYSYRLRLE